ncbi:MAG: MnmC family methyltransferase [Sandaracinaceae bacterium]
MSLHELVRTTGGAWAVRDRDVGQVMHPVVGPLVESDLIYIRPAKLAERLDEDTARPLVLYDVGLGAGSNAIAARAVSERRDRGRPLHIVSFDRTTDAMKLALTEPAGFGLEGEMGDAARAVLSEGKHETERTRWTMRLGELPGSLAGPPADLVFWDAFSPRANAELWTVAAFEALRACCGPTCIVRSFSAATAVRSALLLAGFFVGRGGASASKEETTVASMHLSDLERPLTERFLSRLSRSSAPLPSDAPGEGIQRIAEHAQFGG